jgi:hypothetical protein
VISNFYLTSYNTGGHLPQKISSLFLLNFSSYDFVGTNQREALRPLLLLDLFAEGTNTGIKRVAKANQRYSYDELL